MARSGAKLRRWGGGGGGGLRGLAPVGIGRGAVGKRGGRSGLPVHGGASLVRGSVRAARRIQASAAPAPPTPSTPAEDDRLRSRWLGLIGPMKERLRAEVERV